MMTDRLMIVSADCHWGDSISQYRPYMDTEHLDDFDRLAAGMAGPAGFDLFAAAMGDKDAQELEAYGFDDFEHRNVFAHGTDNDVRLKELEADGIVGEVVFPNMVVPFSSSFTMVRTEHPVELQLAGIRAYNRALADFIDPERQVGLALVSYLDVDQAVKEIHWARGAGLRGVLVGSVEAGLPALGLDASYYDPIWAACVEEGLPVHLHGAAAPPGLDITMPGAAQVWATEAIFYGHRALWFLMWGGVPERFPELQIVFTELMSDWQPRVLRFMDYIWSDSFASAGGTLLTMAPSEYWERQFFCGSSILSSAEVAMRHELGTDKMMFGSDFPHPEGTWGKTTAYLQGAFGAAGVSEADTRKILGENAVRLYGLDQAKLEAIADARGPRVDEVLASVPAVDPHVITWLARPPSAV
jgi:predicted TIM-barrel fold metal-dependent hydrolase